MAIESRDIAKLYEFLNEVCKRYKLFCVNDPFDRALVNFLASWLESWALVYSEDIDFHDVVSDPRNGKVFLSMHSEVFNLARRGLYIYTIVDEQRIARTIKKLKNLISRGDLYTEQSY